MDRCSICSSYSRRKLLHPFFSYYGSRWSASKNKFYPDPDLFPIIEPFAGSAGYSLNYHVGPVDLYEISPRVCAMWAYLITCRPQTIIELPVDFKYIGDVRGLCQEEKDIIGYWIGQARSTPAKTHTHWSHWNDRTKFRIADQIQHIRHWTIEQMSYERVENREACWFIDPPFKHGGNQYPFGNKDIDYEHLCQWCKCRSGQIIVCEANGADWMDFHDVGVGRSSMNTRKYSIDQAWVRSFRV
jgi:hypothetical protein